MDLDQYASLRPSDVVRHKLSSDSYAVAERLGNRVLLIKFMELANPAEWDLIIKRPIIVQVTRPAVEYMVHETGLEPGTAEELLQSLLTMCQVK